MFYFDDFYGKKILKSTLLSDEDCFFTTRQFVLTESNRLDLKEQALKNREFLKNKLNCKEITTAKQVHSANISIVNENQTFYDNTDSLISNVENSLLLMNFADCVPIILYSKKNNLASIVHAGWRGTAQEILRKTVEKIINEFSINPKDLTALIGPSIGKCCFETDEDVFEQLIKDKSNKNLYEQVGKKYFIDLKQLNYLQLKQIGVSEIDICDYCTCCMSDIFFSYRKENGVTARHSAVIKIRGNK
jgi:hypothetical protein